MYCSKCGILIPEKLNYCNSCGEKLGKNNEDENTKPLLNTLLKSVAFISVSGLGLFVALVAVLLNRGVNYETLGIISMLYLATLFGICFSLIRLMSKLIVVNIDKKLERAEILQTPQLSMPTNPQLNEYQQPVGSVTEHTTRTFDEAFVKRN